jgi:NAD(P)-dependent dehydrogenase (short-subunit alcohol dehydrogenase family)
MTRKTATTVTLAGGAGALGALALFKQKPSYSFHGKSVLITGGGRGLGLILARQFAAEGARVVLVGRSAETLSAAQGELSQIGAEVHVVPCDVRDPEQARSAVDAAVRLNGSIDVLINNAGIMTVGPVDTMTLEDFASAMATHAWAPLHAMLAAIPHMRRQGQGRIVNISSIGGKLAVPHMAPYAMSKFALSGLSDAMRAELRRFGIWVTSVYPGLMRTGSHVNAAFKGHHQSEFAWFSLMSGLPVFSINAQRAARQIVAACRKGKPELIITTQARIAVAAHALFPNLVARGMSLMNRLLPGPGEPVARSGWDSTSWISPSPLTWLADSAIDKNNETSAA